MWQRDQWRRFPASKRSTNSHSLTFRSQRRRQAMNHPLIAKSFLLIRLSGSLSHLHAAQRWRSNHQVAFLCRRSQTSLSISSLTFSPYCYLLFCPLPSLISCSRRHVMFRSTVQRISFLPVSRIWSPGPIINTIQSFHCPQKVSLQYTFNRFWLQAMT